MSDKEIHDKISGAFDKAFDSLIAIEKVNRTRIPEDLFKNVFLSLFANFDNHHPDASIQNWVSIAGTPFSPVDVYSGNEFLFTVPPIYSKEAIKPQEMNRDEPLSHIVSIAQKLSMRSPIEGQNYIDNKYAMTSRKVKGAVNRLEYLNEWNAIFKRYNIEPIVEIENSNTSTTKVVQSDIKDELRGDDLDFTPI